MNFVLPIIFVVVIVIFTPFSISFGLGSVGSAGSSSGPRICVIQTSTCNSTVTACGRLGRSNLCQRFGNRCALELANCRSNVRYNVVNNTLCNGLSSNTRGTCSSSSTTNTGLNSNILQSLGINSGSSNVQPIIIQRG